jgi:excisionase family DNA binding protein
MTAVALPLRFCRKQAAEYLGISFATLARLMKAKLIEFVRPSPRKVYFS